MVQMFEQYIETDVPTDAEAERLLAVVWRNHQKLRPDRADERASYKAHFLLSVNFLMYARRTQKPSPDYALSYWCDVCAGWAGEHPRYDRRSGLTRLDDVVAIRAKPFAAAALVSGVPYAGEFPRLTLGLSHGTASRPNETWRQTLATNSVPKSATD
jgi:hypothetical protein